MLKEINQQLKPYVEDRRRQLRFLNQIDLLKQERMQAQAQLIKLEQNLSVEYVDVKKLEEMGPKRFFANVSGNFERRYEKEYAEYLQARSKRDACISLIHELDRSIDRLEAKLEDIGDIDEAYQQLLEMKEKWLKHNPQGIGQTYLQHLEKVVSLETNLRELQEAFQVGQEAEKGLVRVLNNMNKASRLNSMQAKKQLSMVKSSNAYAVRVQRILLRYQKELTDVQQRMRFYEANNLWPLLKFHKKFLSSIATRRTNNVWEYQRNTMHSENLIHSGIISAIHWVRKSIRKLRSTQKALTNRIAQVEKRLDTAEMERIRMLEEITMENST